MIELESIKDMNLVARCEDDIDALINSLQQSVECLVPRGHFERVQLTATIDKVLLGRIARLANCELNLVSDRVGTTYSLDCYHNDVLVRLIHHQIFK
jgi:hypothetical protein